MRNPTFLVLVAAAACTPTIKRPTTPTEYACTGISFTRQGSEVKLGDQGTVGSLDVHDSAGDHYIARSASSHDAIELVVPDDPRLDAQERTYDTKLGTSPADWRLTEKHVCTARGGYSDVLARYIKGESIDELTTSLAIGDKSETRNLLRRAMSDLTRRYYHEH